MKNRAGTQSVKFRLGELFSGPGGLALGAKRSQVIHEGTSCGFEHVWANDYSADSCDTYRKNICPDNPADVICSDVRSLDLSSLGAIDVFAYGFPCNDFSIVGEHKGFKGAYGPLYAYGVQILNHYKPMFLVAENVGGITSANEGKALRRILSDLSSAGNGYRLTAHYYKFEDYGVPQTRHRVIIVGVDRNLDVEFHVPAPTTKNAPLTARRALENPPISSHAENHELTAQSATVVERLMKTKPGENAWTAALPDKLKLNVKKTRLSHIYRRLHPDKPSYTITGSGGGGTHGYHWEEPRALTNRERARLQTFPDDFVFCGSKESVRKQIGMAVSPAMSLIIFTAIIKTLLKVPYDSVPAGINFQPYLFADVPPNVRENYGKNHQPIVGRI